MLLKAVVKAPSASTELVRICIVNVYRELKSMKILLSSRTQAGPGRAVKQEQEEMSRNHVQPF